MVKRFGDSRDGARTRETRWGKTKRDVNDSVESVGDDTRTLTVAATSFAHARSDDARMKDAVVQCGRAQ